MNEVILVVLLALIAFLILRTFIMFSDNIRAKYYHKLTEAEINEITSRANNAQYTEGAGQLVGKEAQVQIQDGKMLLTIENNQKQELDLKDIKKAETSGVGWLLIWPATSKKVAFVNDGRWGLYFGHNILQKAYGTNLPFRWQPAAKDTWEADKIALAYKFKIQQLL